MADYIKNGKKFITVSIKGNFKNADIPKGFDKKFEAYNLTISTNGNVEIHANYYPGFVRALDTLSQVVIKDETQSQIFKIDYLPITVVDAPAYPYRGVMVDTAREYFYPDTIKQIIDGLMLGKLNVFHWHFSDDDSFPMYSESYPDLTDYTAFSKKEIYTPEMVKDIVQYGKIRGIRVIPEFEGPGHMNILGFYPQFKGLIG